MRLRMYQVLILATVFVSGMTVNQLFNQPDSVTKIVKVPVDKLPDHIGLGIKSTVADTVAHLECSTTVPEEHDFDMAIETDDALQTYACIKVSVPQ